MTSESGKRKASSAKEEHKSGNYEQAAEKYVEAAYEYLGANGFQPNRSTASSGLRYLAAAAAILRHKERMEDCRNLCWQGLYISQAVAKKALALPSETHAHDQAERGVWYEFEGDFRTIGDFPDASDAYDRAVSIYLEAGDPESVSQEQFFASVSVLTKQLIRGLDGDTDELDSVLGPTSTLTDWIEFKRRRLPEMMERLEGNDDWTYVV